MTGPDAEGYRKAMDSEIADLERHGTWELVPRSDLIARGR